MTLYSPIALADDIAPAAPPTNDPRILMVPGLNNSGPGHWQTLWEEALPDCQRVPLGNWAQPDRDIWVNRLDVAIREADRPVLLVAHSLGCLAVAWWAATLWPGADCPVAGALLVAPPEVDHRLDDPRVSSFAPIPRAPLPFPTILVGSHDDHYMSLPTVQALARDWGARFADAGRVGHINAESGLGDWEEGRAWLRTEFNI